MGIADITDGIWRGLEGAQSSVNEALFEPVIRLGVTGLARAGKTVFITSLVANLLDRNRMGYVSAVREGRLQAAFLQPQPDDTVPRFNFEGHMAQLTGQPPQWPSSTRSISELRISLRVQPNGLLSGLTGPRTVHIDIVDYPGEWLLDLALLEQSYADWSQGVLERMQTRDWATGYRNQVAKVDATKPLDEVQAQALAASFTEYLHETRAHGLSDCTPGRFLLPGDLAGSPALTFAPLPDTSSPRGSLGREMARRFEAYKSRIVRPFFRDHFARIDRQIVLVDVLGALHAGPDAIEDLRRAMTGTLHAFRPGQNSFLAQLLRGRRVEKILFAATKADHLHHKQHDKLTALAQTLLADAKRRAEFAGAETDAMSIAALRASVEETRKHDGKTLDMVRGQLTDGRQAAFYAGALPEDPAEILSPARDGAPKWLNGDYEIMSFAPPKLGARPGDGPPHIRLDRAMEFLIGDKL
ncbi:MAG: YcjX family protein [Marinibacterium sp.]